MNKNQLEKEILKLINQRNLESSWKCDTVSFFQSLPNCLANRHNIKTDDLYQKLKCFSSSDFAESLNNLLSRGLIYLNFANGQSSSSWWTFKLTEFGNSYLNEEEITPYDPDGLFQYIKDKLPNGYTIDTTIDFYLKESLHAFNNRCYLSSIFCLGATSERLVYLLQEKYCLALNNNPSYHSRKTTIENMQKVKTIYETIISDFEKIKQKDSSYFDHTLWEKINTQIDSVFQVIRITRNEVGHPSTGIDIDRLDDYSKLIIFPKYLITIYELINVLDQKPLPTGITF